MESTTNSLVEFNYLVCLEWIDSMEMSILTIISKVTSFTSLIGSTYVIYDVLNDQKKRKESTYHRTMLGASLSDILLSLGIVLYPSFPNIGDNCTVIGFFFTATLTVAIMYLCSLSTFYLLQLNFNIPDLQMKAAEKWLHLVPWTVGLAVAGLGLATGIVPMVIYLVSFFYITITLFVVYRYVRKIELGAMKFSILIHTKNAKRGSFTKRSRRVAIQGVLYCGSLTLTCIFPTLNALMDGKYLNLIILQAIFLPLHGFYSLLIYQYSVLQKWQQKLKEKLKLYIEERKKGYQNSCEKIRSLFGQNGKNRSETVHQATDSKNDNSSGEVTQQSLHKHQSSSLVKGILMQEDEQCNEDNDGLLLLSGSLSDMVSVRERRLNSLTQIGLKKQRKEISESSFSKSLSNLDQYIDLGCGTSLRKVSFQGITPSTRAKTEEKKKLMFTPENNLSVLTGQVEEETSSPSILAFNEPTENDEEENIERREFPMRYLERQKSMRNLIQLLDSMQKACLEENEMSDDVAE